MTSSNLAAERELRLNVRVYYVTRALFGTLVLGNPRMFSLYEGAGLSQLDLNMVQAWFTMVWLIAEVPCGVFSDRFGHRRSVTAGLLSVAVGEFVYGAASGLFGFMLAEAIIGIGIAFISGADRGLVYNQLSRLNREAEGRKITENGFALNLAVVSVSSLLSQPIVDAFGLSAPFTVIGVVILISTAISLLSKEAPKNTVTEAPRPTFGEAFRIMTRYPDARWVVLVPALILGSIRPIAWLMEQLVGFQGIGREMTGWLFAAANASTFVGIWVSKRWCKASLREVGVPMLFLSSFMLLGPGLIIHPLALAFPILIQWIRAYVTVAGEHEIQLHVPSHLRATVHSVQNSAILAVYLLMLVPAGMVVDTEYGITAGFLLLGAASLVGSVVLFPLRPKG